MRWDSLLERLRESGYEPEELDFMENYGPIVRDQHPGLRGRHVRCVYGVARIRGKLRFESYLFPSRDDAEEFRQLVGTEPGWSRVHNMVIRTDPGSLPGVERVLEAALGGQNQTTDL